MTIEGKNIQVLVEDKCMSCSNRSELIYNVGYDSKGDFYFRVYKNSGGNGYFCQGWKSLSRDIMPLLKKAKRITGYTLIDAYPNVSINSGFFLLACLMNEGIVERWKRIYKLNDIAPFRARMQKLIEAKANLKSPTAKRPTRKTPAKK